MGVKQTYLDRATEIIMEIDPSLEEKEVREIIRKQLKDSLRDPSIVLDNNVTKERSKCTLSELCNWIDEQKPIVSGNATFYVHPEVLQSPASKMLRELKKSRQRIKRQMFDARNDPDLYQQLDLTQSNKKVAMNAEYGASGSPTAAFYSKYSPAATTMLAQSIITTMAVFFESFIGDNMKFPHINECFDWIKCVQTKKNKIPKWLYTPSLEEVTLRLYYHFPSLDQEDAKVLRKYLSNLQEEELTQLYYINNLREFIIRHKRVQSLIREILLKLPLLQGSEKIVPPEFQSKFSSVEDYNEYVAQEMFLNPYSIPEKIKGEMKDLTELILEHCFIDYLTSDSIKKLNQWKRKVVLLVDTDSNVINSNLFISLILDEVFPQNNFGRERIYNDMICANILASILSRGIEILLDKYGVLHHAGKEAREELSMKNEYFFRRLFLMTTKKRYASSIVLREGHINIPFKTEIKGLDFIKAGVTDDVTKRFTDILERNILFSEELQLHELMRDYRRFEKEIEESLRLGSTEYLPVKSYKAEGAYKNPWAVQVFKAVMVWNTICPEQMIYTLSKIKLIKLTVGSPADLEIIAQDYPEQYDRALHRVFGGYDLYNQYRQEKKEASKDGRALDESLYPPLMKAGMSTIAIPGTLDQIPDWIRPLIDHQTIISDVSNSFKSVLESFRMSAIPYSSIHGKRTRASGLIAF